MTEPGNAASPRLIAACDATEKEVRAICLLKARHWPNPLASQLDWWRRNSSDNDGLLMLEDNTGIFAFLRLRSRRIALRGEEIPAVCVTEVCVVPERQGMGLGRHLLQTAVAAIDRQGPKLGYLLCHDAQEAFYLASGWTAADVAVRVRRSNGRERSLSPDERCMWHDPEGRMGGDVVLFGDVF